MITLCLILFLSVAALWFFSNEYPSLFGIYVPTCVLKRVYFKVIVSVFLLGAVYLSAYGDVRTSLISHFSSSALDCYSLMVTVLSALITLFVLKMFSLTGAAVYALLGSMEAYVITSGYASDAHLLLSFLAAPVISFVLSAFLRYMCRLLFDRTHIHLITLSYYLRFAVIAGLAVTAFAVGLNWGGFLFAGAHMLGVAENSGWVVIATVAVILICLSSLMRNESDESAGRFGDFSIYSVLTVSFAVAFTMLFFSFDATTSLIGLDPAPLSVGSLVFAAIAGAETAQKTHLVERDDYTKELLALLAAPVGSMLIAYAIFYVSGHNDEQIVDFTAISVAVLMLVALVFVGYIRHHLRQRETMDKLVYSQQQQIYEHSRALNDMELKVVLSENQALHNSIEMKKQEVMNVALSIVEQREFLESLSSTVKKLEKAEDDKERDRLISELSSSIKQRLSYEGDVDSQYFYAQAESLHEDFYAKLSENFPNLTHQEKRLATLLRLGFSSKYIATLMNITPKSVEISRYRLRQKLGLSKGDNLVNFIKSI